MMLNFNPADVTMLPGLNCKLGEEMKEQGRKVNERVEGTKRRGKEMR